MLTVFGGRAAGPGNFFLSPGLPWPFGVVEAIWALIALRRYLTTPE